MITLDHAHEMALIEMSRLQREAIMSRRLATDAIIVLERAGFACHQTRNSIMVGMRPGEKTKYVWIENGTVDNETVVKLLAERGYNEHGREKDKFNEFGYDPTGPEAGAGFRKR